MKKFVFCLFAFIIFVSTASAECYWIDADNASSAITSQLQGIRVQKTIDGTATVRLTVTQADSATVLLDKNFGEVSGTFDSGDYYLPYTGEVTDYQITLQIGTETFSFLYTCQLPRLSQNSACTLGPQYSGDWPMVTILDLTSSGTSVPICASNLYIVGEANFTISGSTLTVSLSFLSSANVTVHSSAVYLQGNPTSVTGSPTSLDAYTVGESIDITGMVTALVYVPITLSYDPVGVTDFQYSSYQSTIQSQLSLLP